MLALLLPDLYWQIFAVQGRKNRCGDDFMWLRAWSLFKIFRKDLFVMAIAVRNPATPRYIKALLTAAFVYLISPIDLIPDTLPVVGWLDDAVIVPAAVCGLLNLLPASVRRDSELKADTLSKRMPYIFFIAAILVFAWVILMIWAMYSLIFK